MTRTWLGAVALGICVLGAAGCGESPFRGEPREDIGTDPSDVAADPEDVQLRDVNTDPHDSEAGVSDVGMDVDDGGQTVDVPDADDAGPWGSPTPMIEMRPTDWTPVRGEPWAVGPCVDADVPAPRLGGAEIGEGVVEVVGPTGGCVCYAGGCVEIPAGALYRDVELVLTFQGAVADGRIAIGTRLLFKLSEIVGVTEAWSSLRPGSRIRVASRSYPAETQDVPFGEPYIEARHLFWGVPDGDWLRGGGPVSDEVFAAEFEPHVYEGDADSISNLYLSLVETAENYCGDGVLGPHEVCEVGDPANVNLCDIACQPKPTVHCTDGACEVRCPSDFECPDPGPCRVADCDSRVGCVWIPADEGEACETDEVSGWCETGHCVETPRDCVHCGEGGRWLEGECREAEQEHSWGPEPRLGGLWVEGGVYHKSESSGLHGSFRGYLSGPSQPLHIEDGWVDLEYRARSFTAHGSPVETRFAIEGVERELESTDGEWHRVRYRQPIELEASDWLWFSLVGPWDILDPDVYVPGGFDIRRIRYSELGLGICSVGVRHPDAEDGWAECVPRVGDAWCGDACVNLLYNRYHCGECGHVCDSGLFCEGGECVREPVWRDYVDTFPDDCPEGYFGLDCTGVCPGVAEDGVACSGNGLCHDGLWGNGHCYCHEDPAYGHGLNCEFSCDDGIRNGLEQNIDCGGGVCDPCEDR